LKEAGAAILLVSHSMPDIEQYCERALLLDHGTQRFLGPAPEASKHYYLMHNRETVDPVRTETSDTAFFPRISQSADGFDRPDDAAFIDLSGKSQITNGQARCLGIAICNEQGEACNSFNQGDRAVFYFEFEVIENFGVPLCGIVIKNDRGIIVHGKNSWQYDDDVPSSLGSGSKILCRQEVALNLGPGEYGFEVGLAAVTESDWLDRQSISHEKWASRYATLCVVTDAGHFSVGFAMKNKIPVLTHHGIADLPGRISTMVYK
jgi:lipopolysaccharide transport system ATP-binding protein